MFTLTILFCRQKIGVMLICVNKCKIILFFSFFQSQRQFPLLLKQTKRTDSLCVRLSLFLIIKRTENICLHLIRSVLYAHKLASGQQHFHILYIHLHCLTSVLLRITCHPAMLISSVSFTGSCRNPPSPCVCQK